MKKIFAIIVAITISIYSVVSFASCLASPPIADNESEIGGGDEWQSETPHSSGESNSGESGTDDGESDSDDSSGESGDVNEFTVSFDSVGGTAVVSQKVSGGDCAVLPSEPTKSVSVLASGGTIEYEFAGWYNGESEYNFSQAVTEDLLLTAKWNEIRLSPPVSGRR